MPHLSQICLYPIKALDGVIVETAEVLSSGALRYDRQLAMMDLQGNVINGKRTAKVHGVRSRFDLPNRLIYVSSANTDGEQGFHLDEQRDALAAWLSTYLGITVHLEADLDQGFPDDTASPGPTLISLATLEAVAAWFPGMTVEEVRQRFRSNLEIDGVPAFWEDHLFSASGDPVEFQLGDVRWHGINPCQRCIVPTRNPIDGTAYAKFQQTFVSQRNAQLPDTVARDRFNHFYRLAVNTRLAPTATPAPLAVGDGLAFLVC